MHTTNFDASRLHHLDLPVDAASVLRRDDASAAPSATRMMTPAQLERYFDANRAAVLDAMRRDGVDGETLDAVGAAHDHARPLWRAAYFADATTRARDDDAPLVARIKALEWSVAELQHTPFLKAGGVWQSGAAYTPGDTVTFDGSLWICTRAHTSHAGKFDHDGFRLAVKKGRDGKDAR